MNNINDIELLTNQNTVFHCETEIITNEFLKILHEHGLKWDNGISYLEINFWDRYKENTCYRPYDGKMGPLNHFQSRKKIIINVNCLLHNKKQPFRLFRSII